MKVSFTTERCTLCDLQKTDFADALELFTNEQVRAYLGGPITEQQAYSKLHSWLESEDLYLCVRLTTTHDFIGIISVSQHYDNKLKELSYQFLPQYWGKGLAGESIKAFLEYLNESYLIAELIAETQSINTKSCKLLEKLGFITESVVSRFGAEQRIYKIVLK